MTDIRQLFNLDTLGMGVSVDVNGTYDESDLQAEDAADRITTLRCCVAQTFDNRAAGDLFMAVPLLDGHTSCRDHEVDTPHRLAFQSDEGLERALELLRNVMPKNS